MDEPYRLPAPKGAQLALEGWLDARAAAGLGPEKTWGEATKEEVEAFLRELQRRQAESTRRYARHLATHQYLTAYIARADDAAPLPPLPLHLMDDGLRAVRTAGGSTDRAVGAVVAMVERDTPDALPADVRERVVRTTARAILHGLIAAGRLRVDGDAIHIIGDS